MNTRGQQQKTFVDLGSGDGRLVIEAAKQNNVKRAIGYELNPILIALSYLRAFRAGPAVLAKVSFYRRDFWYANLSNVDVVSCFGVNSIMLRLLQKLEKGEHKKGEITVALFRFKFPDEKVKPEALVHADKNSELYVYRL